ncbi:MAG: formylmethanofuran dehydrogenase subunit E family protein [Thermoplasmatota archaeon]
MDDVLKCIKQFHGHLGPYAVIGYRMGLLANQRLGDDPFAKQAVAQTGITPPVSCIVDGIQLASGCTLGKGNIAVHGDGQPAARFTGSDGAELHLTLRPAVRKEIDTRVTDDNIETYSADIYQRSDEELFIIHTEHD